MTLLDCVGSPLGDSGSSPSPPSPPTPTFTFTTSYYGTIAEAEGYFSLRLHARAWRVALPTDRPNALLAATKMVDALNFKGVKHSVWSLLKQYYRHEACGDSDDRWPYHVGPWLWGSFYGPSLEQLQQASLDQPLEFPRDSDTIVPEAIRLATYEIAYTLLDGKDLEIELENLAIASQSYGPARTTFSRDHAPPEHLVNGILSAPAWRMLKPFLRDPDQLTLVRGS